MKAPEKEVAVFVPTSSSVRPAATRKPSLSIAVSALVSCESDPDQPIELNGNDLHTSAAKRLGVLAHGQVYGFITSMEDEDRFLAEDMQVMDIDKFLLRECEREESEIERF